MRTTFSLDIPPDASPAFGIKLATADGPSVGGLEWRIRLYLLVAVTSPGAQEGPDGVRMKHLVRDGPRGEWGISWAAAKTLAPSERMPPGLLAPSTTNMPRPTQSWTSFFTSAILGSTEPMNQYHDGDEDIEEEEEQEGNEADWKEVPVEMVECEVPIKVWPGNTAFKAAEVVFEV